MLFLKFKSSQFPLFQFSFHFNATLTAIPGAEVVAWLQDGVWKRFGDFGADVKRQNDLKDAESLS